MSNYCSQCRHAHLDNHADLQVRGTLNARPYRANLCMAHFDAMGLDGATLTPVALLSDDLSAMGIWAEALWAQYADHKAIYGADNARADRLHAKYIRIADRLQAAGLNF